LSKAGKAVAAIALFPGANFSAQEFSHSGCSWGFVIFAGLMAPLMYFKLQQDGKPLRLPSRRPSGLPPQSDQQDQSRNDQTPQQHEEEQHPGFDS
jgi:hypothetical protein